MKYNLNYVLVALLIATSCMMFSSCATVFGGKISACQKTKPASGQPSRQLRVVPLVLDILCVGGGGGIIGLIVDFSDGAIYKPCDKK